MQNNYYNPLVTIHCWTFNHKPYIQQCLDGFVMQKTEFPFLAVVVDDASTDGEQEVLWDFINNELDTTSFQKDETDDFVRVVAPHKTNKHCIFIFVLLKYNHYSISKAKRPYFEDWEENAKYIAICEGDDYWIDPQKLQKQVDFLETHPVFSCVFHRYKIYNELTKELSLAPNKYFDDPKHKNEDYFEFNNEYNLLVQWTTKTLTMMYRRESLNVALLRPFKYSRDVHMAYFLLNNGKGACMSFVGGTYRLNPTSTFGGKSTIQRTAINRDVFKEFSDKVNDNLLKETFYRFFDRYQYKTLSGIGLLLFRIKRKIRLLITKDKRTALSNKIIPRL